MHRLAPSCAAALACLGWAAAQPAAADPPSDGIFHEAKIGLLHHDTGGLWSGFRREDGLDISLELQFSPHWEVLGGRLRPALGATINTAGDTSKAYLDARWQYDFEAGPFVAVGLGAAVHNGDLAPRSADRKALGSRVLFHIPLEAGFRFAGRHSVSVYFDHVSNAFLAEFNEGQDTIGVRYGIRF